MPQDVRRSAPTFSAAAAVQLLEPRLLFDAQQPLLVAAPLSSSASAVAATNLPLAAATASVTSSLWGAAGERWSPSGRLIDYSYAGYHAGDDLVAPRAPDPQAA